VYCVTDLANVKSYVHLTVLLCGVPIFVGMVRVPNC